MSGLEPPTSSLRTRRSPELSYIPTSKAKYSAGPGPRRGRRIPARIGLDSRRGLAERQGFEPWEPEGSTVFETAPFNHSGTSPIRKRATSARQTLDQQTNPQLSPVSRRFSHQRLAISSGFKTPRNSTLRDANAYAGKREMPCLITDLTYIEPEVV